MKVKKLICRLDGTQESVEEDCPDEVWAEPVPLAQEQPAPDAAEKAE